MSLNPTVPTDPNDQQNVSLSEIAIMDGLYSAINYTNGPSLINIVNAMNNAVSIYLGIQYNNFSIDNFDGIFGIKNSSSILFPRSSFTLKNITQNTNFPISTNCTSVLGCNTGYYPSLQGTLPYITL
jgi:hypothetical protein